MLDKIDIENERAAAAFSNTRVRALILHLVGDERSLTQLRPITGMGLSLLSYHVQKLLRLGLVKITREWARGGRPVKFYRATARSFFVSSHLCQVLPGDHLSIELRASLERARRSNQSEGMLYSYEPGVGPRMRRLTDGASANATEIWSVLKLSTGQAGKLAEEMRALIARYEAGPGTGVGYLVHAALAPR